MEQRVAKAREKALKKARGDKLTGRIDKTTAMAYAYEAVFSEYHHKPAMKFIKDGKVDPKKRSATYFRQAAELADSVRADYETFVRAQFYWMHEWFGRECKTHELRGRFGGFPAVDRYRQYRKLVAKKEISGRVSATSLGVAHISDRELDTINEKRLNRLMRLWDMDEEEVLIAFSTEGIFDEEWLSENEVYQRLSEEGRL
jgi:hypothetical protein